MPKTDIKKELKELYLPSPKKVVTVDVPEMNFLMVDGKGDPNTSKEFQDAVGALYSMSYTLKFMAKKKDAESDFVVPPLEGLWWSDDMGAFVMDRKDEWKWTIMIVQPPHISAEMVEEARRKAAAKEGASPALPKVRFEPYHEGLSAQTMHIGPFSAERPTIEKIHGYIAETGHGLRGKHHEIYLSDPRKTKPERLKTVVRQPMG